MVFIYCKHTTARTAYIFEQVFGNFLNVPYEIVHTPVFPGTAPAFIINYSGEENVAADLRILPSGLLFEETITHALPVYDVESTEFNFDVFSAIFWMITRYEEYLPHTPDAHGRFSAKSSLAYKQGILQIPVADKWVSRLGEMIGAKLPGFVPARIFRVINTIDVDNAYAYKGKEKMRSIGAFVKHYLRGQFAKARARRQVLAGKLPDPFDTYAYIKSQTHDKNIPTYFFHLVAPLGRHDRNIQVTNPAYANLLKALNEWSVQGLHPSYASATGEARIRSEKKMLEEAIHQPVIYSRQHFLKMHLPQTYRHLIAAGIQHDYSMGYADEAGFRAGTGQPFLFFDLAANAETSLTVHPLCVMEGTLKYHMKLDAEAAKKCIRDIQQQLKQTGSTYIAIWHNETLTDKNEWKGWRSVYESQFEHN